MLLTQKTVRRLTGEEKWRDLLLTVERNRDDMKCQSWQRNCCKTVVPFNTSNYYYRSCRVVTYFDIGAYENLPYKSSISLMGKGIPYIRKKK